MNLHSVDLIVCQSQPLHLHFGLGYVSKLHMCRNCITNSRSSEANILPPSNWKYKSKQKTLFIAIIYRVVNCATNRVCGKLVMRGLVEILVFDRFTFIIKLIARFLSVLLNHPNSMKTDWSTPSEVQTKILKKFNTVLTSFYSYLQINHYLFQVCILHQKTK